MSSTENTDITLSPAYESSSYTKHKEQVKKVASAYEGTDACLDYLDKFYLEDEDSFAYRQSSLTLLNFVKRTVSSSRNKIFRKPIGFEGSLSDEEKQELTELCMEAAKLVLRDECCYLVIDTPVRDDTIKTRADELAKGIKPYMYLVERLSVPNWTSVVKNGVESFTHWTRNETYDKTKGRYGAKTGKQQRVYILETDGDRKDKVTVEIWREGSLQPELTRNTDFEEIPIIRLGKDDIPALYDMAKINLNHMNRRSELNRYLRIAGTPVPKVWGVTSKETTIKIGVDSALNFTRKEEGDFQWTELTGSATNLLQDDLKKLEADMFEIASSLTSKDENNQVKTATQVMDEKSEGESRLANIATNIEQGMNKALEMFSKLGGYTAQITLNKDYDSNILTPEKITQVITLYREGMISLDTAWKILVEGEALPADFNADKEKTKLLEE